MRYIFLKHFLDNGAELRFFGWRNSDFLQNKDMFAVKLHDWKNTYYLDNWNQCLSVAKQNGQE